MNLKDIMLSKTGLSQKDKYCLILCVCLEVKFWKSESRMLVARSWGEGEMGSSGFVGTEFQFRKMKKLLILVVQQCDYT